MDDPRHLKKPRNISANPNVALVVPLPGRLLSFLPPPCIQFQARPISSSGPTALEPKPFGAF
jgi:hypothetical protein